MIFIYIANVLRHREFTIKSLKCKLLNNNLTTALLQYTDVTSYKAVRLKDIYDLP